jgi:plastocyanin
VALLLAALVAGRVGLAAAQDDATPGAGMPPHPGHIHAGTCAALGEIVFPLSDAAPVEGEATGPATALPVAVSETTVDVALDDIIAGGHAINFHESMENIRNYIACGDVGGVVVDGTLTIGLAELNDSGFTGVAVLREEGERTAVSVYLTQTDGMAGMPAAGATPAAGASPVAAAGDEVAVEIVDFSYTPSPLEISVGTTVTWTNQDPAAHTVTSTGGGPLSSDGLEQGDTYSYTFEEAGTFDYFCEYHGNMKGSVVVS